LGTLLQKNDNILTYGIAPTERKIVISESNNYFLSKGKLIIGIPQILYNIPGCFFIFLSIICPGRPESVVEYRKS
jgi:hypothetical protein